MGPFSHIPTEKGQPENRRLKSAGWDGIYVSSQLGIHYKLQGCIFFGSHHLRFACLVVGKHETYSPNDGLMVIYLGKR